MGGGAMPEGGGGKQRDDDPPPEPSRLLLRQPRQRRHGPQGAEEALEASMKAGGYVIHWGDQEIRSGGRDERGAVQSYGNTAAERQSPYHRRWKRQPAFQRRNL